MSEMDELKAMEARLNAARDELSALSQRAFRMSIPVQDTDSDMVLGAALGDLFVLLELAKQAAPAPSALDTARAALERIANESDLRMSAYLNSDDMLRDYIGKVVRMKRIAADALAGLEGGGE